MPNFITMVLLPLLPFTSKSVLIDWSNLFLSQFLFKKSILTTQKSYLFRNYW